MRRLDYLSIFAVFISLSTALTSTKSYAQEGTLTGSNSGNGAEFRFVLTPFPDCGVTINSNKNIRRVAFRNEAGRTIFARGVAAGVSSVSMFDELLSDHPNGRISIRTRDGKWTRLNNNVNDALAACLQIGIEDNIPPVITITGDNPAEIDVGIAYVDAGATATDAVDGDVDVIVESDNVDTDEAGSYLVVYRATDNAGNSATAVRTVIVNSEEFDATTISEAIELLEESGALPPLDRNDTLTIVDDNSNGVRDDIDRYIDTLLESEEVKKNMKQFARSIQLTLTVDIEDQGSMSEAIDSVILSSQCVTRSIGDPISADRMLKKIHAYTANTRSRALASIEFLDALEGDVDLSNNPVCEGDE